ncbi:hypothetical protein CBS101457_000329 [Exobasidium rhododendri]|nr:hypothetical protein CBS101457_000329 [Exobasidium rhododendri]
MAVINLASFVSSIPIGTRSLTAALLIFTLGLAFLRITFTEVGLHVIAFSKEDSAVSFPWLVIVPGSSFWYPWTLVTSAFCETSFFEFIISIVSLPLAGRYLERIWGPVELIRFSLIVIVISNVIAWFLAVLLYVVTRGEQQMYGIQYHGLEALQTAFLVAFAQLIPEHQIHFKSLFKVRVRDLPMMYVTFSNIICVLGYPSPFILIQFGWLIGWGYLRFFQIHDGGVRGDRSETFSLVQWFPPFMHRPVTFISNTLYGIFVKVGVIEPWHYSALGDVELGVGSGLPSMNIGISGSSATTPGGGTGGTRAEAERRRAMALKALDQRVKAGTTQGSNSSTNNGATNLARSNSGNSGPHHSTNSTTPTVPSLPPVAATGDSLHQSTGKGNVPRVIVQDASPNEADEASGDIGASLGNSR